MIIGKQLKANVEVSGPAGEAKRFVVNDRRKFLFATASLAVSLPVVSVPLGRICDGFRRTPLTPPGSHSLERFKNHCTACHLCVTHCPQQILKPAALEFGLGYLFKPHLSFYETGYCNYGCTVCSEVCPAGAILRLTEREKMAVQIGVAEFDRSRCVVYTDLTSCGACAEHCPTLAVRMVDYVDGLTVPEVTEDLCIGCGACESICPVRPLKAINVRPHLVHRTALVSDDEQLREIDGGELDFGF
jgi:formate hydrogenlyase subunit 6/NADH:ubiquinone oxidoreductase subunit I